MEGHGRDRFRDSGRLAKALAYCRGEGLTATAAEVLARVAGMVFSRRTIVLYTRSCVEQATVTAAKVDATIREVTADELATIDAVMYHPTAVTRRRFAANHRCFLAEVGGEPACYAWVAVGSSAPGGDVPSLRADQFYIYNVRTMRPMRGQGLYPHVLTDVCARLAAEGFREALIRADASNRPSVRGIEKAGFARAGAIRRQRLLGQTREWQVR